jgi:alginate O-acetyltransferase complex protein AlgI
MIFNTWEFFVFAVPFFVVYALLPRRLRGFGLIAGGLVFYVASGVAYTLLIVGVAVTTYVIARRLARVPPERRTERRALLTLGILVNAGSLVYFKYTNFLLGAASSILPNGVPHQLNIVVPLALSFFTFEFIHFLVDVYLGKITLIEPNRFFEFALFFPTLVAGPIKRYQNFAPQADPIRRPHSLVVAAAVYRIMAGLAKKMIVADSMTPLTQPLLTPSPLYSHLDYWIAMLAYTAKIYFDFSGYSDIAIGLAALMGFSILENFEAPYRSINISEFWRRWHISLSSWIRDYLFIPLGGSRQSRVRTIVNLAFVMAVAGLWHGAAWHFMAWGLWHGAGLGVHRIWSTSRGAALARQLPGIAFLYWAVTLGFVAFGWVLFASPTYATISASFTELLGGHAF